MIGLMLHHTAAEGQILAVGGKQRRLVIAEVAEAVSRRGLAAHGDDEIGNLLGSPGHQRPFQGAHITAFQHPGGDADDVFRRGADFIAQQVGAVIKTDEITGKALNQLSFGKFVVAVDNHAVGDSPVKFLYMAGAEPYRHFIGGVHLIADHL